MTRLTAALVAAALLLPAGARAQGTAHGAAPAIEQRHCEAGDPASNCESPPSATALLSSTPQPTAPQPDHSWHLLTISNGGTVSLIKGLTKRECEEARSKIEIVWCYSPDGDGACTTAPGDIKSAECFQ